MQVAVVLILQDGGTLPRDTLLEITVHGVQNRLFAGPSGAFMVKTMVEGGGVMDQGAASTTLAPGLIRNVVISPLMVPGDAVTYLNLSLTLPSECPADSRLVVSFPPGVATSGDSQVYGSVGDVTVGGGDVTIASVVNDPSGSSEVALLFLGHQLPRGDNPRMSSLHRC